VDLAGSWERDVLGGDLTAVDPRHHLPRLRALVAAAAAADLSLTSLFTALERSDPIALTDLALGPKAPRGPRLIEAALAVVDTLELQLSPGSLFRRLVVLGGPEAGTVLALAAQRHPAASWMVALSAAARERETGLAHLLAASAHPAFVQACWDHAAAGHHDGLVAVARTTGRPETAAALLAHGAIEHAQRAAAVILDQHADARVAPYLVGVWGPDLDAFWSGVVHRLESRGGVERLTALCGANPRLHALLAAVGRGLA